MCIRDRYHPDANINNPNQAAYTEKFKEVQNAYKTIMDDRKRGFTNRNYGSSQNTNQSGQYLSLIHILGDNGRVLVRESGTEPVVRVMVEADTDEKCLKNVNKIVDKMIEKGFVIKR